MSKNKIVKSVSFNKTNVKEKEFLDRMLKDKIEFATYVKELIFADMERLNAPLRIVKRSEKGGITYIASSNTLLSSTVSV